MAQGRACHARFNRGRFLKLLQASTSLKSDRDASDALCPTRRVEVASLRLSLCRCSRSRRSQERLFANKEDRRVVCRLRHTGTLRQTQALVEAADMFA